MDFETRVVALAPSFFEKYPPELYPEMMTKPGRPYHCLIIKTQYDFFICLPYRSNIKHRYSFRFKNTARSRTHHSGIDYTKMVLIKDPSYISDGDILIDRDEYDETIQHIHYIVREATEYLDNYVKYVAGADFVMSPNEFRSRYSRSTLPYFKDILNI